MDDPLPTSGVLTGTFLVSSMLYGVNLLLYGQYRLSTECMKDGYAIKVTIAAVLSLLTIQIAFLTYGMYQNYANPSLMSQIMSPIALAGITLAINTTAFVVQMFFASRVWILSKGTRVLFSLIVAFSMIQLGAGIAQLNEIIHPSTLGLDFLRASMANTAIQTVSVTIADVLITYALCHTLNQSRSGIIRTDSVLDKLNTYAIHRAAATSFAALLTLILFASVTTIPVFMVPFLASGQLYGISMISMLLNRSPLQTILRGGSSCSVPDAAHPLDIRA